VDNMLAICIPGGHTPGGSPEIGAAPRSHRSLWFFRALGLVLPPSSPGNRIMLLLRSLLPPASAADHFSGAANAEGTAADALRRKARNLLEHRGGHPVS